MSETLPPSTDRSPATMRAVVYDRYGSAEAMAIADVPIPEPKAGEVRIRVRATAINSWDWDLLHGAALVRPWGLFRPSRRILGCDVAGVVERVGAGVTDFAVGDAVLGDLSGAAWGGFAEFVCAPAAALAAKPAGMTFEDAAAIPQAGVLALQGLRRLGASMAGKRILVIGAGGGVGTFALELAKHEGAHVTVVDRASKLDALRALGADEAIDADREDFTARTARFDGILDVVGKRSPRACLRSLAEDGRYVMIGGTVRNLLAALVLTVVQKRRVGILAHQPNRADLEALARLHAQGVLRPVIGAVCSLDEVPATIDRLGAGAIVGKAVMRLPQRG